MRPAAVTCLFATLAVASCSDDTEESSSTSTCPQRPGCSGGGIVAGPDGCPQCSYPGIQSCADCEVDEYCHTCKAVHEKTYSWFQLPTLGPGDFRCDWVACGPGQVCASTHPAGDGCPDARCVELPASCENDVTCTCVSAELGGDRAQDDDGNITLSGFNGSIG